MSLLSRLFSTTPEVSDDTYKGAALELLYPKFSTLRVRFTNVDQAEVDRALGAIAKERPVVDAEQDPRLRSAMHDWLDWAEQKARKAIADQNYRNRVYSRIDRESRESDAKVRKFLNERNLKPKEPK